MEEDACHYLLYCSIFSRLWSYFLALTSSTRPSLLGLVPVAIYAFFAAAAYVKVFLQVSIFVLPSLFLPVHASLLFQRFLPRGAEYVTKLQTLFPRVRPSDRLPLTPGLRHGQPGRGCSTVCAAVRRHHEVCPATHRADASFSLHAVLLVFMYGQYAMLRSASKRNPSPARAWASLKQKMGKTLTEAVCSVTKADFPPHGRRSG